MVIARLKSVQRGGQPIREDGPERHLIEKKGTPTMGGVLILLSLTISTLLWADLTNGFVGGAAGNPGCTAVWARRMIISSSPSATTRGFGARQNGAQMMIGLVCAEAIHHSTHGPLASHLTFPIFKDAYIPMGIFFPLFGAWCWSAPRTR